MSEPKTKKAYDRVATSEEIRQVSQQSYDEIADLLDEAHVIHDNAALLVIIEGVAYPIAEIAEHH